MATSKKTTPVQPKTNAVAVRRNNAVAVPSALADDFAADAGKGLANVDADSVAIPFLAVLQTNSPQCDPDSGEYIPDAKAGMLFNTVTKETFDGKEGLLIIPCEYRRTFLQWSPREVGGGFKGEHKPEAVARMKEAGDLVEMENRLYVPDERGGVNPKKNDKVADTRVHYVIVLNPETGAAQQAVLSLSSTQIKKSKQLISLLGNVAIEKPNGERVNPPTFANLVRITTVPEQNDQGKWSGVKFELEGFVQDAPTYAMAKAFHKLVGAGRAAVNYEAAGGNTIDQDDVPPGQGHKPAANSGDGRPDPDADAAPARGSRPAAKRSGAGSSRF